MYTDRAENKATSVTDDRESVGGIVSVSFGSTFNPARGRADRSYYRLFELLFGCKHDDDHPPSFPDNRRANTRSKRIKTLRKGVGVWWYRKSFGRAKPVI